MSTLLRIFRDARIWLALLALGFFGLAFGPNLKDISTHFLGIEYVDHFGTQWFYWFAEHSLLSGEFPDHTDLFFFPWGKDIYGHTGANVLDAYLAIPFRLLLGDIAGYNVFVLAGLLFNAVCFYKLSGEFTQDRPARFVGSLLFTFNPYALYETAEGRPTQAILGAVCLYFLYMWRAGGVRGWKAPVFAGIWLAICGYQYWYYAFFGGVTCLAYGIWRALFPPEGAGGRVRILARCALIAGVSFALVFPAALPALAASQGGDVPGLLDVSTWGLSGTPPITIDGTRIGLYLWQPWLGKSGFYVATTDAAEMFLPHHKVLTQPMVALAVIYLFRPGRLHRGPWLAMMAACVLLAVGPMLVILDRYLPNPLYIGLVKQVGFLQRLWWPGRAFSIMTILFGLSGVAALAWAGRRRWLQAGLIFAVCAAWCMDLIGSKLAPFPTWNATVPAGYRCLAERTDDSPGALIELPYSYTQAHLYYQTYHKRPILGGMIENNPVFTPEESVDFRANNTFIATVLAAARLEDVDEPWTEADRQTVYDLGYRYVVVQKDAFGTSTLDTSLLNNARRTRLRRARSRIQPLVGAPIYEDTRVMIYAPWGDPLPCGDDFEVDTDPPFQNKKQAHLRAVVARYDREIFPLWGRDPTRLQPEEVRPRDPRREEGEEETSDEPAEPL